MLSKIGSAEINATLVKAASILREQHAEIERLRGEAAERTRLDHAEKIATAAVDRGIMEADDAREYTRTLLESGKDLEVVEEFVNRAAVGFPLSSSLQKTASVEGSPGETDVLTNFLLTNDIP